jgi:hypothetical protein
MLLVPCNTTIGATGGGVCSRDPPPPVVIEVNRLDRRDGFRYSATDLVRTVQVTGFPAVRVVTDPNPCVVGRSCNSPDDANGIRRWLFEKFFGEGVFHEFLGIFCTRSDQALFISVFPCYYRFRKLTNWVALRSIESLTGILMTGSIEKDRRSHVESVHRGLFLQYQQPRSYPRRSIAL